VEGELVGASDRKQRTVVRVHPVCTDCSSNKGLSIEKHLHMGAY